MLFGTQEKRTITKNTIWLSIAELITRLSKFALIVYATRILGPTGFGQFSFALSFVMIFTVFADLGLSQITSREISQNKKGENEFESVLWLKFALSFVVLTAVFIISKLTITDTLVERSILILSVFMITNSISDFFFAFFQAKQKMNYESLAKVIQAFLVVSLGFFLLSQFKSSTSLSISYALSGSAAAIYITILYILKRNKKNKAKISIDIWQKYILMSWPLILTSIFSMIYNDMDSVMMGYYGQITQVGWYNAAYRVIGVALLPAFLINRSFAPEINATYSKSMKRFKNIGKSYLKISFILALATLTIGILCASQIIHLIFGPDYLQSVLPFQILMIMAFLTILIYPLSQTLIAAHLQKNIFKATLWGAAVNLILNFLLIPKYSLNGAAISTLIAVGLVFIIQYYFYLKIQEN